MWSLVFFTRLGLVRWAEAGLGRLGWMGGVVGLIDGRTRRGPLPWVVLVSYLVRIIITLEKMLDVRCQKLVSYTHIITAKKMLLDVRCLVLAVSYTS
jgi:hypothetical protein